MPRDRDPDRINDPGPMAAEPGPADPASDSADRSVQRNAPAAVLARRSPPSVLAAIAVGGALGTPARYGVAQLIHVAPGGFPWATFWTNISGSLALGLFVALIVERFPPNAF